LDAKPSLDAAESGLTLLNLWRDGGHARRRANCDDDRSGVRRGWAQHGMRDVAGLDVSGRLRAEHGKDPVPKRNALRETDAGTPETDQGPTRFGVYGFGALVVDSVRR
jgi:hypothetical protein